jgi:putative exosortase-associated protein (TIGR04073 family)
MRTQCSLLLALSAAAIISTGCGGMERKLGRGLNNVTEFARGGEMRRSIEQTALFDGPEAGYTTGFIRGFNRSLARTVIGISEVVTAPIPTPTYDPYFFPDRYFWDPYTRIKAEKFSANPVYPDSYKPRLVADQIFATDTNLGFSGGDVAPFVPGSRFRIFDY